MKKRINYLRIPIVVFCLGILLFSFGQNTENQNIKNAIERQLAAYPESTLQDIYKNFYHDFFGPEHSITDTARVREYLYKELSESDVASPIHFEPAGSEGQYVRVYLSAIADGVLTAEQLLTAFIQSANSAKKQPTGWSKEWENVVNVIKDNKIRVNGFDDDVEKLTEAAHQNNPVHHSAASMLRGILPPDCVLTIPSDSVPGTIPWHCRLRYTFPWPE